VILTKNLSLDYGRVDIRANAICPGIIETLMFASVMDTEGMGEIKEPAAGPAPPGPCST